MFLNCFVQCCWGSVARRDLWWASDERIARSPVAIGWNRTSASLPTPAPRWIDGELVHLEDLVLHDAGADVRAPTHELTIARDVLKTRRRIASQSAGLVFVPMVAQPAASWPTTRQTSRRTTPNQRTTPSRTSRLSRAEEGRGIVPKSIPPIPWQSNWRQSTQFWRARKRPSPT